jgi:hypothetical protein
VSADAPALLARAVSELDSGLADPVPPFRAAFAAGDYSALQLDALEVERPFIAFNDTLRPLTFLQAVQVDAAALVMATRQVEAILESLHDSSSAAEIRALYGQIPGAQSLEQTRLNKLAGDLALQQPLVITPIVH